MKAEAKIRRGKYPRALSPIANPGKQACKLQHHSNTELHPVEASFGQTAGSHLQNWKRDQKVSDKKEAKDMKQSSTLDDFLELPKTIMAMEDVPVMFKENPIVEKS